MTLGLMFFHSYCGFSAVTANLNNIIYAADVDLDPDIADIAMKLLLVRNFNFI